MNRLGRDTAIVTGTGSGNNKAIARRLAAEGTKVVVNNDLNQGAASATVDLIVESGGIAAMQHGDVSSPADIERVFEVCEQTLGGCMLLVNNAGIVQQSRFADLTIDDWDRMIAVHLRGTFLGCKRALGHFGEPGDVAATVAFLASDDAKIYVGQTLGPNSGDVML